MKKIDIVNKIFASSIIEDFDLSCLKSYTFDIAQNSSKKPIVNVKKANAKNKLF